MVLVSFGEQRKMIWRPRRQRGVYIDYFASIGKIFHYYGLRDLSEEIKFYSDASGIPAGRLIPWKLNRRDRKG